MVVQGHGRVDEQFPGGRHVFQDAWVCQAQRESVGAAGHGRSTAERVSENVRCVGCVTSVSVPLIVLIAKAKSIALKVEVRVDRTAATLYYIEINGKAGFIDSSGEVVVPPRFNALLATYFSEGRCPFEEGGLCGFIDEAGAISVSPLYSSVLEFSKGLAAVCRDGLWGFVDRDGNEKIEPSFDDACGFASDGLATVKRDGKWGYIDTRGKFVIQPKFDEAYDFDGDLAKIEIDDRFGYVDRVGNLVWFQQDGQ